MGHLIFIVLHVIAVLFGLVWLIVTIPAHLIYGAVSAGRSGPSAQQIQVPTAETHRPCPYCKEMVLRDAIKCRFCASDIAAAPLPRNDNKSAVEFGRAAGRLVGGEAGPYLLAIGVAFALYLVWLWGKL